jgi:hypothetical protein
LPFKYLSGEVKPTRFGSETSEKVVSSFNKFDISSTSCMSSWEEDEPGLWLGCRDTEGIFFNVDFTRLSS